MSCGVEKLGIFWWFNRLIELFLRFFFKNHLRKFSWIDVICGRSQLESVAWHPPPKSGNCFKSNRFLSKTSADLVFAMRRFAEYEGMKINLFAKLSLINRFNLVAFFEFLGLLVWTVGWTKNMGRPKVVFGSFVKSTFEVDREFWNTCLMTSIGLSAKVRQKQRLPVSIDFWLVWNFASKIMKFSKDFAIKLCWWPDFKIRLKFSICSIYLKLMFVQERQNLGVTSYSYFHVFRKTLSDSMPSWSFSLNLIKQNGRLCSCVPTFFAIHGTKFTFSFPIGCIGSSHAPSKFFVLPNTRPWSVFK